ncbi:cytoskeletal protein CcmA (bactofilin family) [Nitrospirillum amazonense]|uniref:Cytoskeletal protein CcmA (Bactofilin family) n=1 Tax=Nitrospirillum amazonense TaxID=28077 RepID=A0A560FAS8_9PROT|nr:polymer-forming cytoskeletal protein [Nitrospirillum amazonense]TWB18729.1 cytoskeletal protein CcmA (bactofilin family) [Nitrospirillum amazonense]
MASDILDPRSFLRPGLNGGPQTESAPDLGGGVTTISPEARIEGAKISHCHTLHVAGRLVDVTLNEVKVLEVAEGGHFEGTAVVESMKVSGRATGTIEVTGTLSIGESGQVDGTIRYGRISIADGGSIAGTIQSGKSH